MIAFFLLIFNSKPECFLQLSLRCLSLTKYTVYELLEKKMLSMGNQNTLKCSKCCKSVLYFSMVKLEVKSTQDMYSAISSLCTGALYMPNPVRLMCFGCAL